MLSDLKFCCGWKQEAGGLESFVEAIRFILAGYGTASSHGNPCICCTCSVSRADLNDVCVFVNDLFVSASS